VVTGGKPILRSSVDKGPWKALQQRRYVRC
jgi:hypothetical protein